MTKEEILKLLRPLNHDQEQDWMLDLGMQLTVSARGEYPLQEQPGSLQHLTGFNEMQHQVYGRIRHVRRGEEWTIESFLDGLQEKARYYGVEGGFSWALNYSLRSIP